MQSQVRKKDSDVFFGRLHVFHMLEIVSDVRTQSIFPILESVTEITECQIRMRTVVENDHRECSGSVFVKWDNYSLMDI